MTNTETFIAAETGPAELSAEGGPAATRRGQWAWALYEAARDPNIVFQIYVISPFFATVMIRDPIRGQELWGSVTAYSGYITALLCPFLGAIADRGGPRKPWLALFTLLMVLSFAGTWFGVPDAPASIVWIVSAAVVVNNVVFEFSNAFHGAMLPSLAPAARIGGLSGLSFALGSGAGFVLMVIFLMLFMLPHAPIVLPEHVAERLSGPVTALWMLVFAVPLFLYTPDRPRAAVSGWAAMKDGVESVMRTVFSLRHYRNVAHYIGARALFNDGLTGVLTFSGIYIAGTFHLGTLSMIVFGLTIVLSGAVGGFFGGWLDDRFGSRVALLITVGGTALCFGLGLTMGPDRLFWFIPVDPNAPASLPIPFFDTWPKVVYGVLISLAAVFVVGAYANNRTMLARIAPVEKMTEFFGLMSLSGTAATFLAPLLVAEVTQWTHSQRGGMVAIVVLLAAGWVWMLFVKEERETPAPDEAAIDIADATAKTALAGLAIWIVLAVEAGARHLFAPQPVSSLEGALFAGIAAGVALALAAMALRRGRWRFGALVMAVLSALPSAFVALNVLGDAVFR
jgi:UMF1 family MFS transporter